MTTEFKVMPWLRELRDRNAAEEQGLTIADRLQRTRDGAREIHRQLLTHHPETKVTAADDPSAAQQRAV